MKIKTRLVVSMTTLLLPLVVLGISALFLLYYTAASIDEVVEEAMEEIQPVIHLQILTLMMTMPPHNYLIGGDPKEKEAFVLLSRELDRAFEETIAGPFGLKKERDLIRTAREEWRLAKASAVSLLAISRPVGNRAAARERERMDAHVQRSVALLGQIRAHAHREAEEASVRAHALERWALALIAGIFITGVILAAATAFTLTRSLLHPLQALERGAHRFGEGDLSHRVALASEDELGELAKTFNAMAETLANSRAELEALSTHDGLTGLYNHREFHRRLTQEVARFRRYGRPFSLVMLDLDHFKAVNDRYGHQAGDEVLRAIAVLLRAHVRPTEQVARYGGEEFMVLLPETGDRGALVAAERIRGAVAAHPVAIGGRDISVTVSIGVASFPENGESAETLIAAADQAMYAAKHAGRNRVCSAG